MTLLLLLSAGLAQVPPGLAPTPQELQAGMADLERQLTRADTVAEALSATQNAYAQRRLTAATASCDDAEGLAVAARTQVFGQAYRDLVQSARAQSQRVQTLSQAPTVTVLAEGVLADDLAALERRLDVHERRLVESIAWQKAQLSSTLQRCKPALSAGDGFDGDRALRVERGRVAVLVLEGGQPYPQGEEITGGVWLVPPSACWAPDDGECEPSQLAPGAVLGPLPAEAPVEEAPPEAAAPPEATPVADEPVYEDLEAPGPVGE